MITVLFKIEKYFISDANIGNVGLAITQTIGLVGMVQWGVRQLSELENQMTSVERIIEYSNAPQESAFESPPSNIQWVY